MGGGSSEKNLKYDRRGLGHTRQALSNFRVPLECPLGTYWVQVHSFSKIVLRGQEGPA